MKGDCLVLVFGEEVLVSYCHSNNVTPESSHIRIELEMDGSHWNSKYMA